MLFVESCYNYNSVESSFVPSYEVKKVASKQQPIEDWYICGAFSLHEDSLMRDSLTRDIDAFIGRQNPDSLNPYWYNGIYKPLYNLLDLREVYNIQPEDSKHLLHEKITYLACDIQSEKEQNVYLEVKKSMKCYQQLNGDTLHRREIQGLNFYPIHLHKGYNRYFVKTIARTEDYSFESAVLDSNTVAQMYVNGQSNNIVFPLVDAQEKMVKLTNAHQNLFDVPVRLNFYDKKGVKVYEVELQTDSESYHIPTLKEDCSYMCSMSILGQTVRQPIVCGDFDNIYDRFSLLRSNLQDNHPRAKEIDQILYRLRFLLHHESRKDDWWWQFKIAPLTYQLEVIFANLNGECGKDKGEFNIQFITYTSELDGGIQRYMLATPNNMEKGKKYPLVVVVRPHVEKLYHFFTSPQFAHQWAINIVQSLANSHNFIVMLPEARMYQNEDLTPFAEAEMKLAIEDVKKHYSIDENKIYLHGICTGGYRALRMATENPNMFAALGLYTPTYHEKLLSDRAKRHSLETLLPRLAGVPIMIFADPFDKHTPYKVYADLITDCQKYSIPVTYSFKRNTELLYNTVVVGTEAFDFFDGKSRRGGTSPYVQPDSDLVIADLYSSPFVYVYNAHDNRAFYKNLVKMMKDDYAEYMNTTLPLVAEENIDETMLKSKNLFLIGDTFINPHLSSLVDSVKQKNTNIHTMNQNTISIHQNALFPQQSFVIYSVTPQDPYLFKYPWIDGVEKVMKSSDR